MPFFSGPAFWASSSGSYLVKFANEVPNRPLFCDKADEASKCMASEISIYSQLLISRICETIC